MDLLQKKNRASHGLHQGFPLSPFSFLSVVEGLSFLMKNAKIKGELHGVNISLEITLMHLLSMDEVMLFGASSFQDFKALKEILNVYCEATKMEINLFKYSMMLNCISEKIVVQLEGSYPIRKCNDKESFKYLGFYLKSNS